MIDNIKRYYELKQLEAEIKVEKELLNAQIKKWMMKDVKKNIYSTDDYTVKIQFIDMRKFSDDIIPFLKNNGFEYIVETKEVFDYEKLKKLIKSGKIDPKMSNKYRTDKGKNSINLYVNKVKNV